MKIKTNLSTTELLRISKGLEKAACKKCEDTPASLANPAEESLVREVGASFSQMIDSLQEEFSSIFSGD